MNNVLHICVAVVKIMALNRE